MGSRHKVTTQLLAAVRPLVIGHRGYCAVAPENTLPSFQLALDAHADLRDGYLGEPLSHAAAMRRVLDIPHVTLVSAGVRAISKEEVAFYQANRDRIAIHWAKDQGRWSLERMLAPLLSAPDADRREDPPNQVDQQGRG